MQGREMLPSTSERVSMYRRFYVLMKEHFGDDAMGRRKAFYFAPWHHAWFHRYRSMPRSVYEARSLEHPLIMTRTDSYDPLMGEESIEALDPVERLLRNANEAAHMAIADALWESGSDGDALLALARLQADSGEVWEQEFRSNDRSGQGDRDDGDERG